MRNSYKAIENRRERILNILSTVPSISIQELSQRLNVSEMTVRRDCSKLSQMGRLKQKKGIVSFISPETASHSNSRERIKRSLGEEAVKSIGNNEIVFVNSSTTALYAIPPLLKKNVSIVTNNGNAAQFLSEHNVASLILSGGNVNKRDIMSGDIAQRSFSSMRSDWSIIGCAGISVEHGITTPVIEEANINRTIIRNSRHLIVVADYSKFGNFSNFTIGQVDDIDILITDPFVSAKTLAAFRKKGINIIQVTQL